MVHCFVWIRDLRGKVNILNMYTLIFGGAGILSSKTNISKFQFDPEMHGHFERVLTPWYSVSKKIHISFFNDSIICVYLGKFEHYSVYIL